jgi:hypothetical protein
MKCSPHAFKIFLEPTHDEQKAKMPPPLPNQTNTVLVDEHKEVADEAIAAAAAVVDASVTSPSIGNVVQTTSEQTAAAAQIASFVDRTYGDIVDFQV